MNNGTGDHMPEAIVLPGGLEFARGLAEQGVGATSICEGSPGHLGASRSAGKVLVAPIGWGSRMEQWFAQQALPEGSAILPGNDDAAWWLASRDGLLGRFRYGTPGLESLRTVLIKRRLYDLCREVGVALPQTQLAEDCASLPEGPFPLMVKPQTRIGLRHWNRGRLVRNQRELVEGIAWFRQAISYGPDMLEAEPGVATPLVQEYIVRPRHEVYHLVGYRSRAGESVVAAHRKILQYPLRFGSGLCFESAPVDGELAAGLERLLAAAGFHGIFEAEYVERDGKKLLIDLNPRTYNGIGLETRRGYALPWYLYLDTVGEQDRLSEELAKARTLDPPDLVWRDSIRFWTMLAGQSLSGGMTLREAGRWVGWSHRNRSRLIDPYFRRGDRKPGFVALRGHLLSAFTEPRAFLGTYVRRGLDR